MPSKIRRLLVPTFAAVVGCVVPRPPGPIPTIPPPEPEPFTYLLPAFPQPTASGPPTPPAAAATTEPSVSSTGRRDFVQTDAPFDLAVDGAGFFAFARPDGGVGYTRFGVLGVGPAGELTTQSGHALAQALAPVPADAVAMTVGADGTVIALVAGGKACVTLGRITLATFANPGWLRRGPDGLWSETPESGAAQVCEPGEGIAGTIRQGFREKRSDGFADPPSSVRANP
ncbi:flagellar hook-basal body protein [Limnoglobus roseus]|uniref:Flagellar basal-body rod protein FlgG n=1 Tax=Limnoglobus roseus TaxID=2598579 RepID=A0A5C1ALK2_9BACT|nr:flagellar hook basal-body protein [Limnoglobus roseus]QEL18622.1 flagellar basal-body rod protein FlgG [Limnoglobus roseus]